PIRNGEKIQGAEKLARMASLRLPSASSTLATLPTSVAIARNGVSRSAKVEPLMGPSDSSTRWKCSPANSPRRLTLKSTARWSSRGRIRTMSGMLRTLVAISSSRAGVNPRAQWPPTIAPMLAPATTSMGICSRSSTSRTPICANPQAAPHHPFAVEHVDGAGHDQIERVGVVACAVDDLALLERNLAHALGNLLALRLAEAAECGKREKGLLAARAQRHWRGNSRRLYRPMPWSTRWAPGWSDRADRSSARDWRPRGRGSAGSRSRCGCGAPPGPAGRAARALDLRDRAAWRSRGSGGPEAETRLAPDEGRGGRT